MAHNLSADALLGGTEMSPIELSQRFDEFKTSLADMPQKVLSQDDILKFMGGGGIDYAPTPTNPYEAMKKALSSPDVTKGMSDSALASIMATLESVKVQTPDVMKDFNLTTPIPSGAVAFDLQAPMLRLTPRPTPVRNRTPRGKGFGTSHRFKVLSGATGTGTGGVGVIHPGISDTTQNSFAPAGAANALNYVRGAKISYAGFDQVVPYMQFGASDLVTWSAQYAGQGFEDIRQLSRTYLLYSSMLLEERMMLYGRGTQSPYLGTLTAPTIGTATARAPAATEIAITGAGTNVYVRICAELADWGVSQASAVVSVAVTPGQVADINYTLPAGATGARAFVSTGAVDPGDGARWLVLGVNGRSATNKFTLQGPLPTGGQSISNYTTTVPNAPAVNLAASDGGTGFTQGYDGIWAYCTGPQSGYVQALNAPFSTSNPGVEYQNAFAQMYDNVKAEPDRILLNGRDRKQLSDTLKAGTSSNYSLRVGQDEVTHVTLGVIVPSIVSEISGKPTAVEVHPWLPQGCSPILSDTLPIPDTQVTNVWEIMNVQEMMGIDWPVMQFTYDASSYWFGTFLCYAPPWNGAITGIQKV